MMHPKVEETTTEPSLCELCVRSGGLEEGLLHGSIVGNASATKKVSACFDLRVRLSFVYELRDRIERELFPKKVPG